MVSSLTLIGNLLGTVSLMFYVLCWFLLVKRVSMARVTSQVARMVKKNPPANAGDVRDVGSIPGSGKSPGGGSEGGNPLQDSCLEKPMDRGTWQATVHGVAKSRTWLNDRGHNNKHYGNHHQLTLKWFRKKIIYIQRWRERFWEREAMLKQMDKILARMARVMLPWYLERWL